MIFLINLIDVIFKVLFYFVLAHIILSWLPRNNPVMARINEIVDSVVVPILIPFRKVVPVIDLGGMGLDLTPFVVLILINFIQNIIHSLIF